MKIRTQFLLTMFLFGLVLIGMAASVVITYQQVDRLNQQSAIAHHIEQSARDLNYLSNDFLLYGESQQRARWESRFAAFSEQINRLNPDNLEQQALINNIRGNRARLQAIFDSAVSTLENPTHNTDAASELAFIRVSWSRMEVLNQDIVFDASQISEKLTGQMDRMRQTNEIIIFVLVMTFAAYFIANYVLIYRHTLQSIAALQEGTKIIGLGNLDFAIPERRPDEIGALARAFNSMTANLKQVTASKSDLEREITERKRIEQERERLLAQVQAQATDLQNANEELQCQSEELETQAEELRTQNDYLFETQQQLRESEVRFRIALIQSGVTVFSQDPELRYTWDYNPHPHFSAIDRIGKTDADLYAAEDAARLTVIKRRVWETGEEVRQEISLTIGGETYCYDLVVAPVRAGEGTITGLIGSALDITEQKKTEAAIQSYTAQLIGSNKELQEFAFVASHDLKEPLRKILAFSQRIGNHSTLDETEKDYLSRVQDAAQRMHKMIDALLELSRITTHKQPFEQVNLNQVAINVVDDLEGRIHKSQGQVILNPLPSFEADPIQMHQLLQNLVGNALKFRRPDAPPVVQVGYRDHSPGKIEIYVQDNGIGFDMGYLDQIFLPFKRLHGRSEYEGSGIGLAVCQKIAERHGGWITAQSAPGEGSTFSVVFPVKQVFG